MDEKKDLIIKHLGMIQTIVERMARNSFMLKGWSLTVVAALLALSASAKNSTIIFISYLPAIAFWVLDAYFLSQERYFRRLYDRAREPLVNPETEPVECFAMNAPQYAKPGDDWFSVMRSPTLFIFYGMIAGFITCVVTAVL
ncbi:MAG: hypothetical protein AB7S75_01145 [Desulfococcaceae bacterium]